MGDCDEIKQEGEESKNEQRSRLVMKNNLRIFWLLFLLLECIRIESERFLPLLQRQYTNPSYNQIQGNMNLFDQQRKAVEEANWAHWQQLFPHQQYYSQDSFSFMTLSLINPQHQNQTKTSSINSKPQRINKQRKGEQFFFIQQEKESELTIKEEISSNKPQVLFAVERLIGNKKMAKTKRKAYPTKNFLPAFRESFLSYLKKHFKGTEQQFKKIEIISGILSKKGINLIDYQNMFNQAEFRPILQNYFKQKVILRDLMASGIRKNVKRYYFSKVHVFEEAFRSGKFEKINY